MSLPAPEIDNRTFEDLVAEARARIPRYTPEWTDLNDSDPGMTLVQLHAWLTETILHQLNRVPDLNYVKFLDLLGITPMPARAARTELTFTLDKLDQPGDPLVVDVPIRTKVAVDDPELTTEVVFETDRTLRGLNAHVGAVVAQTLVTGYDAGPVWLHSFPPFDPAAALPPPLYLGLLLRPFASRDLPLYAEDRLPAGPLDLYVETAPESVPLACADLGPAPPRRIAWQVYTGGLEGAGGFAQTGPGDGWTTLALSHDDTLGLTRSGHLVLELPASATPLDPALLPEAWWEAAGHPRPPRTQEELVATLQDPDAPEVLPGLAEFWPKMGVPEDDAEAFAACGESVEQTIAKINSLPADRRLRPANLTFADWIEVSGEFAVALPQKEGALRPLYWLRARVTTAYPAGEPRPATLRGFHLNTVPATQAATRLDDGLGRSSGRPAQTFTLPRVPVLVDPATGEPDLDLAIGDETWARRADFFRSGPDDPHYRLDPATGTIALGDGERGRVPVAGLPVAGVRYRTGGGAVGNVPAGTISKIKGRLRDVKAVTNLRAAHDGSDAEPLDRVKLRAPHDLRVRDRAVTAEDFADLARQTPGAALHKAYAVARRAPRPPDRELVERDGAVTVVVLPTGDDPAPQPTEEQLRAVCRWLEPRRLITTELHVVGPRYLDVDRVAARIAVDGRHDLAAVAEAAYAALLTWFHPIRGGADGAGWPFGEDIAHGDVYEVLLGVDGVRRVTGLAVTVAGPTSDPADLTPVPDGHLPRLTRASIDLVTGYE
ncbi:putative baseplate assembly protein [Actinoplanes sp. NPDC049596]|uniref:putative baseplate assembly protein n=1 Tax=unclassified Actinoplanes TaxID=2626549 RepID=UPI0034371D60